MWLGHSDEKGGPAGCTGGTLAGDQKVMVDVGTGYYIEKTIEGAKGFFQRRNVFLKEKIEQIQPIVMGKMREK